MDAALRLAPPGARFTLLHVTSAEAADAARGAYGGLFGRRARDPATRLEEMAAAGAGELLEAAAARLGQGLGRGCDQLELQGRTERVVVAASAEADLLIAARDGAQARLGPKSLGRATGSSWTMRPARSCWSGQAGCPALLLSLPHPTRRHIIRPRAVTEAAQLTGISRDEAGGARTAPAIAPRTHQ